MNDCIFCKVVAGELPSKQLLADDRVVVFMDIHPVSHGHCLVVTKEHRPTLSEITDEECAAVMVAARRVVGAIREALKPDGVNLHQSNGVAAGQVVGHFHLHVIPRWEHDGAALGWRADPDEAGRVAEAAEAIGGVLRGGAAPDE